MVSCKYVTNWVKSFEVKKFLGKFDYHIEFLDKPYITGATGSGKTSLLKLLNRTIKVIEHGSFGPFSYLDVYFPMIEGMLFTELTLETFGGSLKIICLDGKHYWVTVRRDGDLVYENRCEEIHQNWQHDEIQTIGEVNSKFLGDDRFDEFAHMMEQRYAFERTLACSYYLRSIIDERNPDWYMANIIANVPYMYGDKSSAWDYKWQTPGSSPMLNGIEMMYDAPVIDQDGSYSITPIFGRHKPSKGDFGMLLLALAISGKPGTILVDDIDMHMHMVTQEQMPKLLKLAESRGIQIIATTNSFHLFENEDFSQSTDLESLKVDPKYAYNVIEQYNIVPTTANKREVAFQFMNAKVGEAVMAFGMKLGIRKSENLYEVIGKKTFTDYEEMTEYAIDYVNDPAHLIVRL